MQYNAYSHGAPSMLARGERPMETNWPRTASTENGADADPGPQWEAEGQEWESLSAPPA